MSVQEQRTASICTAFHGYDATFAKRMDLPEIPNTDGADLIDHMLTQSMRESMLAEGQVFTQDAASMKTHALYHYAELAVDDLREKCDGIGEKPNDLAMATAAITGH